MRPKSSGADYRRRSESEGRDPYARHPTAMRIDISKDKIEKFGVVDHGGVRRRYRCEFDQTEARSR